MKTIRFLLVLILLVLIAQTSKAQSGASCFTLSLNIRQEPFRLKEPIMVTSVLSNMTGKPCKIPIESPLSFEIEVKDQSGRLVGKTPFFMEVMKSSPSRITDYTPPNKDDYSLLHDIEPLFLMDKPGVYSVTFFKKVYQIGTNRMLRLASNTIRVSVNNRPYPRTTSDCFTLYIKPEKEAIKRGELIKIIGVLRNKVDETCAAYWSGSPQKSYSITVKNQAGVEIPKIQKSSINGGGISSSFYGVSPGKEVEEEIFLNDKFKIEAAGEYSISVIRDMFEYETNKPYKLTSNTIKIRVVE